MLDTDRIWFNFARFLGRSIRDPGKYSAIEEGFWYFCSMP
jgi:hypothetical protein